MPSRVFGHYTLRRLLGKSEATMIWLGVDSRTGGEAMLTLPRVAPPDRRRLDLWLAAARRAARLDHPQLAPVAECGAHEQWPFVAVDRRCGVTLDEWRLQHPPKVDECAAWIGAVLRGLAFAHDAGVAHRGLQLCHLLINERGQIAVMALAVAHDEGVAGPDKVAARPSPVALEPGELRAHRAGAERDVLACGVLLHGLLAGAPALEQADVGRVIARMAPRGRDLVRLPWQTPQPVPDALRAIVNRSTSSQVRLRYRNARTFLGALDGWREAFDADDGGPVARLLDRLRTVGPLPALPGLAARVQRVTAIESQRTDEIAQHLLPDLALSLELLRTLNSAHVQGTQVPGNGPVLTLRRVVALIGVDGVRQAANTLRVWPGPLDDDAAAALRTSIERVRLAGHVAQALRPAGYDAEVTYLVAALQNLGRLMLRYHFADDAEQIAQLMTPMPAGSGDGDAEQPGLGEEAAAYAVIGVDVESLGAAAARHCGLADDVLHMIRRLPVDAPVRKPDDDAEWLRIVGSAANEAVEAIGGGSAEQASAAIARVVDRYGRVLKINARAIHDALTEARAALRSGRTSSAQAAEVTLEQALDEATP